MKKPIVRLGALCAAVAVWLTLLAGCDDGSKPKNNGVIADIYKAEGTEFDSQIKGTMEFVPVAENDSLILSVNGSTAEIKVTCKDTGDAWYSNPQERYGESFIGETKRIYSQLIVEYNVNDGSNMMNSFSDGVLNNQYSFSAIENGLRVNFVLGTKPREYMVPQLIEKSRFEELITQLNEYDAQMLKDQYILVDLSDMEENDRLLLVERFPVLDEQTAYITQMRSALLTPSFGGSWPLATDYFLEQLEALLIKAGYTQEEFDRYVIDNKLPKSILSDTSIALSIEYTLEGDTLVARVPHDSIAFQDSQLQLTKITVLPAFGAASVEEEGYILLPDGSGALSYLNKSKENTSNYSALVYGGDATLPEWWNTGSRVEEGVYMPVFGIKTRDKSFLAILEEGDALAEISSQVSSESFTANVVNATFCMNYTQHSATTALSAKAGLFYQDTIADTDLSVRYCFQHGEKATYVGMAEAYREYLLESGGLQAQDIEDTVPLFLNIVQAVNGKRNILGIPVDRPLAVTTSEQVVEILETLAERQVSAVDVELQGWANGGYYHTAMNQVKLMGETGGKKGLNTLLEYADAHGVGVFPSCNFQSIPQFRTLGGLPAGQYAARTLENVISYQKEWSNTFGVETPVRKGRDGITVSPAKYTALVRSFLKEYNAYGFAGVSGGSFGYVLGGDYREGQMISRQGAKAAVAESLQLLAGSVDTLAVEGANLYTLADAGYVYGLTVASSEHNALDETVPFYQAVLHGVVPYAGEPANKVSDFDAQLLKYIETGTIPAFLWMYEENVMLKNTAYTSLNSTCYVQWLDKAVQTYQTVNEALAGCMDATMVAHDKLSAAVSRTVYSSGITVYVNYSGEAQTVDGVTVPARSYLRVEKEGV